MATPSVFFPGKSHRQRSLAGYSPRGHRGWDRTEQQHGPVLSNALHFQSLQEMSGLLSNFLARVLFLDGCLRSGQLDPKLTLQFIQGECYWKCSWHQWQVGGRGRQNTCVEIKQIWTQILALHLNTLPTLSEPQIPCLLNGPEGIERGSEWPREWKERYFKGLVEELQIAAPLHRVRLCLPKMAAKTSPTSHTHLQCDLDSPPSTHGI